MAKTLEERYFEALQRLRVRVDVLEEMARWKADLTGRLWRAEEALRITGTALYDTEELEREARAFAAIAAALVRRER